MVVVLQSVLADANFDQQTSALTWRALNSLASERGAPSIDYKRFDARWKEEGDGGVLHRLVDRYDGHGLVLKTDTHEQPTVKAQKGNEVSKMAKRATAKAFS